MVSFIEKGVFHKVMYSNTFLFNTETIVLSTDILSLKLRGKPVIAKNSLYSLFGVPQKGKKKA